MSPVTLNCLVAGENSYENDLKLITDIIFNDKAAAQFMLYQRNLGVADSYDQLPCIEIGSSATPEEISNSAIEDFLIHKASLPITSANEATGCEFISAIIYGVASIFDGTVKVIPKDLQQRAKMEDNEAQLAEQLLNSGWNKLVKTVKDFVIVDKSEEATVSTYVDGAESVYVKGSQGYS
ncbi:hypothetical protein RhiirA1_449369 [Rhizophagus irregularis]|uniref:Uncharacterized protein n=1 Tax=Rhizophagus irregularis TaxID=588596 RepID=A0A2N0SHB9_9GLOM|nr:hypothetical protein RhiirA1_449369 [Rhizophagus irregularis]